MPLPGDPAAVARYEAGIDAVAPDDLLTIIYTSGTTGEPKGVMLTHDNLLSNIAAVIPVLELNTGDVALSYLPLSHVFERMVTYLYLYEGLTVCHAESMDTLARDLQLVRPTVMTGVPRVYEKLHAKIHETAGGWSRVPAPPVRMGGPHRHRGLGGAPRGPRAVAVPEDAGGRRRRTGRVEDPREARRTAAPRGVWQCGPAGAHRDASSTPSACRSSKGTGSPRRRRSSRSTRGTGLASAASAASSTVSTVAIAEDGEILTRGPHVMKGYWNRPDETAAVLDAGRLVPHRRHRHARRRRVPHDHGSEEGTAGDVGRQEDRARADRGAPQAAPAGGRGDGRRRGTQVPGGADRAEFRGPRAAAQGAGSGDRARARNWSRARTSSRCSTRSSSP